MENLERTFWPTQCKLHVPEVMDIDRGSDVTMGAALWGQVTGHHPQETEGRPAEEPGAHGRDRAATGSSPARVLVSMSGGGGGGGGGLLPVPIGQLPW